MYLLQLKYSKWEWKFPPPLLHILALHYSHHSSLTCTYTVLSIPHLSPNCIISWDPGIAEDIIIMKLTMYILLFKCYVRLFIGTHYKYKLSILYTFICIQRKYLKVCKDIPLMFRCCVIRKLDAVSYIRLDAVAARLKAQTTKNCSVLDLSGRFIFIFPLLCNLKFQ